MTYSLDTGVLIKFNDTMPHDIVPGLWSQLDNMIKAKKIFISEEVKAELTEHHNDFAATWIKSHSSLLVKTADIQDLANEVIQNHNIVDVNSIYNQADPYVIAAGEHNGSAVVSTEKHAKAGAPLLKIPDVCDARGLDYFMHLDFLRDAKIVLGDPYPNI